MRDELPARIGEHAPAGSKLDRTAHEAIGSRDARARAERGLLGCLELAGMMIRVPKDARYLERTTTAQTRDVVSASICHRCRAIWIAACAAIVPSCSKWLRAVRSHAVCVATLPRGGHAADGLERVCPEG